jgi:hypothetical protein
MSSTPFLKSSDGESFALKLGYVYSLVTITGNTTDTSSSVSSKNPMVRVFLEEGIDAGTPASVDSGNGFGTLDDDADPAVIGVLVMCGDAAELYEARTTKKSGDLTAATPTPCGASSTGVTASGNLAVTYSLAGVDIDLNTNVQVLGLEYFYRKA